MKSNFKTRFLADRVSQQPNEAGFTLIELLMVIIILGILSAIAMPPLLKQANKAKQVEAKIAIGSMNHTQQSYYLENSVFTENLNELGIGLQQQTEYYEYKIKIATGGAVVTNNGLSLVQSLRSYVGVTYVDTSSVTNAITSVKLCESPSDGIGTEQNVASGGCPANWKTLAQ